METQTWVSWVHLPPLQVQGCLSQPGAQLQPGRTAVGRADCDFERRRPEYPPCQRSRHPGLIDSGARFQ